jgi:hypothetical protein
LALSDSSGTMHMLARGSFDSHCIYLRALNTLESMTDQSLERLARDVQLVSMKLLACRDCIAKLDEYLQVVCTDKIWILG